MPTENPGALTEINSPEEAPIKLPKTKKVTAKKAAKSLGNTDVDGAKKNVSDLVTYGNGDMFQLLCKASSKNEGWMKSTKAMDIPGVGCVVQVTTQQGDQVAEALTFVPRVTVATVKDTNGIVTSRHLRSI